LKRPARSSLDAQEIQEDDAPSTVAYEEEEAYAYKLEKYYKTNVVGIRRKFGDKEQIFSVSHKAAAFAELVKIAEEATSLISVMSHNDNFTLEAAEASAKTWAQAQALARLGKEITHR